jgi:adenosylhomocysteine nucleosidase
MPPPATSAAILAVVGMRAEAALLPRDARLRPIVSGGDPRRLAALLAALGGEAAAVLSFGIAGGLDPALAPGDLVVSTRVRGSTGDAFPADMGWAAALARATGARLGGIAGARSVVGEPAAKRALHLATGALAVDLESEAAAAFAAAHGLPFAALRAVADTAGESLPAAASVGLTPEGRPAAGRVALALLRRPRDLPALFAVARRARTALASLERAAAALPGR